MMTEMLEMMRTELESKDYKVNCETVRTNLELSPQKKPSSNAPAMFYKDLKDDKRDQSKISSFWDSLQVSCAQKKPSSNAPAMFYKDLKDDKETSQRYNPSGIRSKCPVLRWVPLVAGKWQLNARLKAKLKATGTCKKAGRVFFPIF